jgi:hypothetical protein
MPQLRLPSALRRGYTDYSSFLRPGFSITKGGLAFEVVVPFFEGFQELVRTFYIWGRHFLGVCRTSFVKLRKGNQYQGF